MHLKSLTMRGFKSFASATTLAFEPGVTCVVGPNGAGKSNVVDALAWVMGEQGARTLRGAKMEDVIFAGTSARPPLGRAEVSLTIDNADGALPIEYSEVTISRVMFRTGGSEYSINGSPCRLLDVQELLSDSGIGREMHVIVGQGQLDAILRATPEERRGFVEEAAGVLKHRKRKERAVRKLEAMSANLTRVQDLAAELRRQLTPLGKQAEVARRASVVQADLRDASLRLLADDLVGLRAELTREVAGQTAIRERRSLVEAELAAAQAQEALAVARAQELAPQLRRAQQTWFALSALGERLAGTVGIAQERLRTLAAQPQEEDRRGRDPEQLLLEARRLRGQELQLARQGQDEQAALNLAVAARTAAEAALATAEQQFRAELRAAADLREGLARLAGQVAAARSRVDARVGEIQRLAAQAAEARGRAAGAEQQFRVLESSIAGLDAGEEDLDAGFEAAEAAVADLDRRVGELLAAEADLQRDRAARSARVDALSSLKAPPDATAAVLRAPPQGILGALSDQVEVEPGYERAVAAALGGALDALVADDPQSAVSLIAELAQSGSGHVALVVCGLGSAAMDRSAWPTLGAGCRWVVDCVRAHPAVIEALTALCDRVAVVDGGLEQAVQLATAAPAVRVCTLAGEIVGRGLVVGGAPAAPSRIELGAELTRARDDLATIDHELQRLRFALAGLRDERDSAAATADAALASLHESDARMAAVAEQLGALGAQARSAGAEAERLERSLSAAREALTADRASLEQLEHRLARAEASASETPTEPSPDARDAAAVATEQARRAELEARLAMRTSQERVRAVSGRAEQLERAAAAERAARQRAAERQAQRARAAAIAGTVFDAGALVQDRLVVSRQQAERDRDLAEQAQADVEAQLAALRARLRTLQAEQDRLTSAVHREEVARAEHAGRIQDLENRAMAQFGIDPAELVSEYGPDVPVPPSLQAPGDEPEALATPYPYERAQQERRLRTAERALALLGRVNPLALEEFAALEQRHRFLTEQLDDLRRSRKDLLAIIRDVDHRVVELFAAAYQDTAAQFEQVFARLFPGGDGRLLLTDPQSLLTTGVDVEARPPGKKVRRLSLLSGGERSLTAVAFLVALFKARPSPFYVLDEVEAALDDLNLGRLIEVIEELRQDSQLIVITHQKRTMEVADALYGVTMRGDGVTRVISQRLRGRSPERPDHAGAAADLAGAAAGRAVAAPGGAGGASGRIAPDPAPLPAGAPAAER